jgi:hypothetical protein
MVRIRMAGLIIMALLAMSAIVATAAQAVEGPYFNVAGKRLGAGETREVLAKVSKPYVLKFSGAEVKCTAQKLASGAKIIGASAGNPGLTEQTVKFEGCGVTGNGPGCEVKGGGFQTPPLLLTKGYSGNRAGKVLGILKPKSGGAFATVQFVGSGCTVPSATVEGQIAGEAIVGGTPIEVGKEPPEAKSGELAFPSTPIKTVFEEKEEKVTEVKVAGLKVLGVSTTLEGSSSLTLAGEPLWGVYT